MGKGKRQSGSQKSSTAAEGLLPEQMLWIEVIRQAIRDSRRPRTLDGQQAYQFLSHSSYFFYVCDLAGVVNPQAIRSILQKALP